MAVAEQIKEKVKLLPPPTQYEVLDFVEYPLHRSRQEDLLWSKLSLRWALRDLDDKEGPEYGAEDLRETWPWFLSRALICHPANPGRFCYLLGCPSLT